jgi:hypothetical protein
MPAVTMVTLDAGGQTLWLLPERALFLPDSDTLLLADVHVGANGESLSVLSDLVRRLEVTSSFSATFCTRRAPTRRP